MLLQILTFAACAFGDSIDYDAAAVQSRIGNLTREASARVGLSEENLGDCPLEVHVVNFAACSRALPNAEDFYKGMIVNSWGYRNKINGVYYDDYTAVALGQMEGSCCQSDGPSVAYLKKDVYTWEWIKFPNNYDVRQGSTKLDFYAFNGLPIMYLPLMSWEDAPELRYRYAYMLRVTADPMIWVNYVTFLKERADKQRGNNEMEVHKWTIDFAGLYNSLYYFRSSGVSKGIEYYGKVKSVKATSKVTFGGDRNQYSLVPTKQGSSGEFLCGFATVPDLSWYPWKAQIEAILPFM